MITDTDLREKVVKLMAMAGTEGEAYCEWTVNQLVHGLREAVVGASAERVEATLEGLLAEGLIKRNERDGGKPQFVLTKKLPVPEPLNESPVAVQLDPKALAEEVVSEDDPQARFQAQQQLQTLIGRIDNLEEVMGELNRQVGGLKEDLGALSKEVQAQSPRFAISDVRQELGRRIGKCEIQLEGLESRYDGFVKLIEGAVEKGVEKLEQDLDEGVGVVGLDEALQEQQLQLLIEHWKKLAHKYSDDSKMSRPEAAVAEGRAAMLRACAKQFEQVLSGEKIFAALEG
jgi:regulator of replication initiation timing